MKPYNPQPPTGYTRITQYEIDLYKNLQFKKSSLVPDQVIEIMSNEDKRTGNPELRDKWLWNSVSKLWERHHDLTVVAIFATLQGIIEWYRMEQRCV
jgi:hypothetical protein